MKDTNLMVANAAGNPAYPPLLMFKILLLQRWYNISDMAAEEALCDRLPFVRFTGLSLDHDEVPDATTICRFRQSLVERNILKRLLDKLNHQLERQELLVREGAIVDASVVSSTLTPMRLGCTRATGRITATRFTPPRAVGTILYSAGMPHQPIGPTRKNSSPCWMQSM